MHIDTRPKSPIKQQGNINTKHIPEISIVYALKYQQSYIGYCEGEVTFYNKRVNAIVFKTLDELHQFTVDNYYSLESRFEHLEISPLMNREAKKQIT